MLEEGITLQRFLEATMKFEAESFTVFAGIYWWLSAFFECRGKTYAHLMREDEDLAGNYIINYAELSDDRLVPVSPLEFDKIAKAYRAFFLTNIRKYGEAGIPIVGQRRPKTPRMARSVHDRAESAEE